MNIDPTLQQQFSYESVVQRPQWQAPSHWTSPAALSADSMLGYESALPWTLGVDTLAEVDTSR